MQLLDMGNFGNNKIPPRSGGNFFRNNKTPARKSDQKFLKVASPSKFYATQSTEPHFVDANTTSGVSKNVNIRQNTSEMNVSRRVHIIGKNIIKKY